MGIEGHVNIQELQVLTTTDLLNSMLSQSPSVQIELLESRPAEFPFLKDGASNNALFLELRVKPTPADALPERLVLKAGTNIGGSTEREIAFFRLAAERGGVPGVVACFGQKMLNHHDLGLMLLEHVPADAIAYAGPEEAHLQHYSEAVRILATLHAMWWEDPSLGSGELMPQWTSDLFNSAIPLAKAGVQQLLKSNSGAISHGDLALLRSVLSRAAPLMEARAASGPLCVTHGDSALWNFVMDRNKPTLTTLVDLQMWNVNPPAWDLAYMMHLLWPTNFRRQHGDELVETYLIALEAQGVNYGSKEFEHDLRISIIGLFIQVLAFYQLGIWNDAETYERIKRLLLSFDELDGETLLADRG